MKRIIFLLLLTLTIAGCNNKGKGEELDAKNYIESLMNHYYYWYSSIPKDASKTNITVYDYFKSLLWKGDRWSWMMSGEQWTANETGVYYSYGGSLSQPIEYYNDYEVRVRYVYPDSPFADNGVKRGWKLTHLGGIKVERLIDEGAFNTQYNKNQNTFTFRDEENVEHNFGATVAVVATKSVLETTIFTEEDFPGLPHPVGYLNYMMFNSNMLDDIHNAFKLLKQGGVGDLILDLRYNGGGSSDATTLLASYLAPASADNEILVKRKFNDKLKNLEESGKIVIKREENSLDLDRLFIITGSGTASASELIINGLKPLTNIICVGDTTYGKPNGMYAFPYPEGTEEEYYKNAQYVILPICFYSVNKNNEGDYEDGIKPTHYRADDLYHDWGVNEDNIKACLSYIKDGAYPNLPAPTSQRTKSTAGSYRILNNEDLAGYGLDIDQSRP